MKALVLLNMGAPRNLDEVELFLKNMFNDENIITTKSKLLRKFIAFIITNTRKNEAKENYRKIGGRSPLVENSENLIKSLQKNLKDTYVTYAMRYTPPFSQEVIRDLMAKNIDDITLIPLYPQYSTTTTKSSLEEFLNTSNKMGFHPTVKIVERFYKDDIYCNCVIEQIKKSLTDKNPKSYDLIFSAHSLPLKIVQKGDTYEKEIKENIEILKNLLEKEGVFFNKIHLAYQSKLGPVKWLEPSLEDKLKSIENKNVIIYPISFVLDNSETIYELHMEYKNVAQKLGFRDYQVCHCPNNSKKFTDFLQNLA